MYLSSLITKKMVMRRNFLHDYFYSFPLNIRYFEKKCLHTFYYLRYVIAIIA